MQHALKINGTNKIYSFVKMNDKKDLKPTKQGLTGLKIKEKIEAKCLITVK